MYAGHHPVRYSPHHGPGYYEDQRRFHQGGYSPNGWSEHGSHAPAGYGHNGYPRQGAYGSNYGSRYSPPPSYGTRTPSPQWTEHDESVRREHQDSRYNELMNNSPVPTASRRTPVSQLDNASTIDSSDDEWQETTYTVSDEEPAASVSCTNLLFGSGKKKAGLINCNRVDPTTTEVELNINMPRMKQLEKSVDQYMDRMAPSDANIKSAMEAFHCKAEPIQSNAQYAQYARYDYDTYYDEPSYIREAYQHPPPSHHQVRRPMPSEVYESALFSEGSASTEEEEEEVIESMPPYSNTKHAPREIIVDNHDTVSVLSDRHLANMGFTPREQYDRPFPPPPPRHVTSKPAYGSNPLSPRNRESPLSPSVRSKGFKDSNEKLSMHQNVDENGLKKDSESSSLVPLIPDEIPREEKNEETHAESYPKPTLKEDQPAENPSFDEPGKIPIVGKSLRKKAEILTDDDEVDRRMALRSPRQRMLMNRSEAPKDAPSAADEYRQEKNSHRSPTTDDQEDELMGKSARATEDELMGKSQQDPEDELMGGSQMIMNQNVLAESLLADNDRAIDSLDTSIDGLLENNDDFVDPYAGMESVGEEVDYMPSTRAAAALIENMMGTLTKQPLRRISEEGDFPPNLEDLDFHSCDESYSVSARGGGKKDLYRFL